MKRVLAVVVALLLVAIASVAVAAPPASPPSLAISEAQPIELQSDAKGHVWEGSFTVTNRGTSPVGIRSKPFTSEMDPRAPAGLTVMSERASSPRLAPGASQKVLVRWAPGAHGRIHELYGHVEVDADDVPAAFVGVHAEVDQGPLAPITTHLLSLLVLVPLFGALVAFLRRDEGDRVAWPTLVVASVIELALAIAAWAQVDPTIGRSDGNEGLQLIERTTLGGGVEYFVGLDGASLSLVIAIAVVGVVAALASRTIELRKRPFAAALLLAIAGSMLATFAYDTVFLLIGWAVAMAALAGLVAVATTDGRAWRGFAVRAGIAFVLLAIAVVLLGTHGGRALLADGTETTRSFGIAAMIRADYARVTEHVLGLNFAAGTFALLLVATLVVLPLAPFHAHLAAIVDEAPPPVSLAVASLLPTLALGPLVRIGFAAVPEGAAWAATTVAWIAAVAALLAAASAATVDRLRRIATCSVAFVSALALLGVASETVEGIEGTLAALVTSLFAGGAVVFLASLAAQRVRVDALADLRGIWRGAPLFGASLVVALVAISALPGSLGGVSGWLAIVGAFPTERAASLVAALAMATMTAASGRVLWRSLGGTPPASWAKNPALEPYGGVFPELVRHERHAVLPLAILLVVLGIFPRPLLDLLDRSALEIAAFVSPPGPMQISALPRRPHAG